MKTIYLILLLIFSVVFSGIAQEKYSTKNGTIVFEASVPSFEEVKANHTNVSAILNADNGEFASLVLINGFRFKVALMEEHFNENYMESSKYPKAIFKGKLTDFSLSEMTNQSKEYKLTGIIIIHGVSKPFETIAKISKKDNTLELETNFTLSPSDFDIQIPKIVSNKIAETVNVTAKYSLLSK